MRDRQIDKETEREVIFREIYRERQREQEWYASQRKNKLNEIKKRDKERKERQLESESS